MPTPANSNVCVGGASELFMKGGVSSRYACGPLACANTVAAISQVAGVRTALLLAAPVILGGIAGFFRIDPTANRADNPPDPRPETSLA